MFKHFFSTFPTFTLEKWSIQNIDIVNVNPVPRMYPDLPPPSYAESVWGVANVRHAEDEHTMGDWEFVPRYVTYNTQY